MNRNKTNVTILLRQVRATTLANLKQRYRGSVAGLLWVMMSPLATYLAQCFVFQHILKLQVHNYLLFLLSGLLPWLFIVQSLEMGTNSFVNSGRLLKSFPVNPLVPLLALIVDNFMNIGFLLGILYVVAAAFGIFPLWKLLLMGIPLASCFVAVVGLCWLFATLQVFFRDVRFVVSFALHICFFLTPIFYPENFVDPKYRFLLWFNPFRHLLTPMRDLITDPISPFFVQHCAISWTVSGLICLAAALYWKRKHNVVYFHI